MKLKNYAGKSILLLILTVLLILNGCAGSPKSKRELDEGREIFNGAAINNRLTLNGETLLLPEAWSFIPSPATKGTLFNFRSPEGIEGGLERIDFDYDIDFSKLVDFYEEYVFQSDNRIKTELIDHERFGTVAVFNGIDNDRILQSLLIADGNDVTFLHFSSGEDTIFTLEEALLILETYEKDERKWVSIREMANAPLFTSIDNTWYWYGDFKTGFYMARKGEDPEEDMIAGLWSLTPEEVNQLKTNADFDIESFVHTYRVQNNLTEFTVYGQKKDNKTSRLYTVFNLNSTTYCLYLIQGSVEENEDPRILLEKPEIQDLLDFNLLFLEEI